MAQKPSDDTLPDRDPDKGVLVEEITTTTRRVYRAACPVPNPNPDLDSHEEPSRDPDAASPHDTDGDDLDCGCDARDEDVG